MPAPRERRSSPRLHLSLPIEVSLLGRPAEKARTADVSASGLLFLSRNASLFTGCRVALSFQGVGPFATVLPAHVLGFRGEGRVVRVAPGPEGYRSVAIGFERPLEPEQGGGTKAARPAARDWSRS